MTTAPWYTPIEPQHVPPEQFYPAPATSWTRRLMMAVLEEGCTCLNIGIPSRWGRAAALRLQREAREWFASDDTSHPFAFVRICEALGFDPAALRREVLADGFRLVNEGIRNNGGQGPQAPLASSDLIRDMERKEQSRMRRKRRRA